MAVQRGGRAPLKLSAGHLAELAGELRPLVCGYAVHELVGLPPRDVVLVFQADAGWRRLRISASPDGARVHLQHARAGHHDGPLGPFFRRARDELTGAVLAGIEPIAGDRLVRLDFEREDGPARALVAELTGRHSNLVLLDEDGNVLELLVPPPARRSGDPPRLRVGGPWRAPDGGSGAPPSAPLLEALPAPLEPAPDAGGAPAPLSWRVEASLGKAADAAQHERLLRELRQRLQRKRSRADGLLAGLEKKRVAAEEAERVRQDGELLKANLGALRRGMERVVVTDYFAETQAERTLELDPRRTPQQNLQKFFDRYQKLLRSQASVEQELALAQERAEALREIDARAAAEDANPIALEEEARARGLLDRKQVADPRKRERPEPRKPYRQFCGSRGSDILVGRSAADNDQLSLRIARGNDVWLHTRDAPGSHVVLRTGKGREPDPEEVLDAAHLAIHFSPLKETRRAAVHVARRKHVHKPKGAKPGLVTLSGGRVLEVRMQPERVQRLLATARTSPTPGASPAQNRSRGRKPGANS